MRCIHFKESSRALRNKKRRQMKKASKITLRNQNKPSRSMRKRANLKTKINQLKRQNEETNNQIGNVHFNMHITCERMKFMHYHCF